MIEYEVVKEVAVLGTKKDKTGQACEVKLCRVRWSGSRPMWDLRMWSADGKPLKGLTLTGGMMRELRGALDEMELAEE